VIGARALGAAGLVLALVGGASPAGEDPLQAATRALKIARRYLRSAPHDYEGHRTTAVAETTAALDEVRRAIAAGPEAGR
jgi:hypothetical protein